MDAMIFNEYGNWRYRHGVYPYPVEDATYLSSGSRKLVTTHKAAIKRNQATLPQKGKTRFSLQTHWRLCDKKNVQDVVEKLLAPSD